MAAAKPNVLVREYIEKMSGDILEDRYRLQLAELIRGHAGLYALYRDDALYYVGLATDLMRRIRQHQRDHHAGKWNWFSVYLTSGDEHLKPLESLLLRVFRPVGNTQTGRLVGASDGKRALNAAMRKVDDAKRNASWYESPSPRGRARPKKPDAVGRGAASIAASRNLLGQAMKLQAHYKRQTYRAVLNKDGSVRYAGTRHPSLSASASAITGRATNGWLFWRYRDADGEWQPIAGLR